MCDASVVLRVVSSGFCSNKYFATTFPAGLKGTETVSAGNLEKVFEHLA